jgi:hypothetical protein
MGRDPGWLVAVLLAGKSATASAVGAVGSVFEAVVMIIRG